MKVDGYEIPDGLYYSREHEWVRVEGDRCRVGITDYAQATLHDIVYVELPKVGSRISQMQQLGTVESVKAVSEIYSPISGEVLEVNEELSKRPELVNESPYGEGWIAVIKPSSLEADLRNLMDPEGYSGFLRDLLKK
ncbi:MAG: glycine cleavage system protein GcvH [Candidatus Bathyarchaeia archaeon]